MKQENNQSDSKICNQENLDLLIDSSKVERPIQKNRNRPMTRKQLNENRLMRWCAALLSIGTAIITYRYLSILILAAWLSSLCQPLLEWLVNHLPLINRCRAKSSRSAIAAFLLVIFVLVVVLPLIFIIIALTGSTIKFVSNLTNSTTVRNAIHFLVPPVDVENATVGSTINGSTTNFVDFLTGDQNATYYLFERILIQRDSISDFVQLFGGKALSVISTVAGATAQLIVGILIFLVSTYTFLLKNVELWQWSVRHSPLSEKHMTRLRDAFLETGRGLLVGVGLTCLVQGLIAAFAYLCLRIPRWYALGVLTGLCSLIPILGTAIVWIPITIGLALQQAYWKAVIMVLVGVFIIGSVDNVLRPIFSKIGSLKMSTLLLLLTIFGGLEILGAWGALLGPLVVRLTMESLILVREDLDEQDSDVSN